MNERRELADRLAKKHVCLRTMNGSGEWIDTRWCAGCGGQTEWPCDPHRAAARIAELEAKLAEERQNHADLMHKMGER